MPQHSSHSANRESYDALAAAFEPLPPLGEPLSYDALAAAFEPLPPLGEPLEPLDPEPLEPLDPLEPVEPPPVPLEPEPLLEPLDDPLLESALLVVDDSLELVSLFVSVLFDSGFADA